MKNILFWIFVVVLIAVALTAGPLLHMGKKSAPAQPTSSPISISPSPSPTPTNSSALAFPIADFSSRITKKPFGIYITPANSPVQPERFTGYHTGVDVEYMDTTVDVPVYAVAGGVVTLSETASGYGGVFIIKVDINGAPHSVLYGHIRPSSLPQVGQIVTKGEQLAMLGTGYSPETDGERRHLHFSVLTDDRLDIRGYVQTNAELAGWINPLSLY